MTIKVDNSYSTSDALRRYSKSDAPPYEAGDDEDMVLTCELDAAVLDKARRELPCADHRRM